MRMIRFACVLILTLAVSSAHALIRSDVPVSKRYELAKRVIVGQIDRIAIEQNVVVVKVVHDLKAAGGPTLSIKLREPAGLIQTLKVGEPVVAFVGARKTSLHIGDTWLIANSPTPAICSDTIVDQQGANTFPGTTGALAAVVEDAAKNKYRLIDEFDGKPLSQAKETDQGVAPNITFFSAVDVKGNGRLYLLVGTDKAVKVLMNAENGHIANTLPFEGAHGVCIAAGAPRKDAFPDIIVDNRVYQDVDGNHADPPLLPIEPQSHVLANSLRTKEGSASQALIFTSSGQLTGFDSKEKGFWHRTFAKKIPGEPLAASIGDFFCDGSDSVLYVEKNTVRLVRASGDEPPLDLLKLTGEPLQKIASLAGGFKDPTVTAMDINGDGRLDVLICAETGNLLLINRGYGVFFSDATVGADVAGAGKLIPAPLGSIKAKTAIRNADGADDLLVLTGDGRLVRLSSSIKKGK